MKKLSLSLILVLSLQATPVPARAGNGMTDMITTMMQMFLWMMSGGSGNSGFNPYSMNPYSFGGPGGQGFPYQGGFSPGNSGGWGRSPYSQYGYAAGSPYYNPYNSPYNGRYSYNRYAYTAPYGRGYNQYRPDYRYQEKKSALVIQPIIVSPGQNSDGMQTPKVEYLPAHTVEPVEKTASSDAVAYDRVIPPPETGYDAWDYSNPLPGRWQGVNGEFLELGSDSFRLRSRNIDMLGTYQIKNGIMKAVIFDRSEPIYMQFRMAEGQLVFQSENGQLMLFHRMD
jgi:hypothetical protein